MWIGLIIAFGLGAVALSVFDDDNSDEAPNDETVTDEDGTITGTSGADTILVDTDQTTDVLAGDGDDIVTADEGPNATIIGADIYGGAGDDQIDAREAATSDVYGGEGNDIIQGASYSTYSGNSVFYGGEGDDQLDLDTTPEFDSYNTPSVTPALYGDEGSDTFNINLTQGALDFDSFADGVGIPDSGSDVVARIQDFDATEDTLNIDITSFVEDTQENPSYTGFTLNEVPATDDVAAYMEVRLNFELEDGKDFTSIINLRGGPFPTAADINITQ